MAELKNEFSWSQSRHRTFAACPRQYWYHYYGSWGGWKRDANRRARELYLLKNLQTRHMWAGSLVHDAIKRILHSLRLGSVPERDAILSRTVERMRQQYRVSVSRRDRERSPKRALNLFEHEYQLPVSGEDWRQLRDRVTSCLANFLDSPYYSTAVSLPEEAWLPVEELQHFVLDGEKLWVQLDFPYRNPDGSITLVDWKTGAAKGEEDLLQLSCYAMFARSRWKVEPERIFLVEYNLARSDELRQQVSSQLLEKSAGKIRASISEMKRLLTDPQANAAEEARFEFTDDPGNCRRCNFQKACPRAQERELNG